MSAPLLVPPRPGDAPLRVDETGVELKRGAFFNTVAMLASNLRGIFTFLVARLLGPEVLGLFSLSWATLDLISKLGIFGLDNTITTFIARSEAANDRPRSRILFRLAVALAVLLCAIVSVLTIAIVETFGARFGMQRKMMTALEITICALPGVALYRMCTAVSRGMRVMHHDIYSRGFTDSLVTTIAFLAAIFFGLKIFAPEVAVIIGTAASGVVALCLAASLFRNSPPPSDRVSLKNEAREMLAFSAPTSAHQLLNMFISRLDVLMLGAFIGRAPGVTLATVGIYSAVVEIAVGLRKINQTFNPIFAPVVAGMTSQGDHDRAAETYAQIAQWMLWILLPSTAAMVLAGDLILRILGPAFPQGAPWLGIVAIGLAINAFVSLGETVIMVQRPRLNLLHSSITTAITVATNLILIPRYGPIGAAFGILIPFSVQGLLRYYAMRFIFKWKSAWSSLRPPIFVGLAAALPAIVARVLISGLFGQIASAIFFLAIFAGGWLILRNRGRQNA